jgi:hypothetical protein
MAWSRGKLAGLRSAPAVYGGVGRTHRVYGIYDVKLFLELGFKLRYLIEHGMHLSSESRHALIGGASVWKRINQRWRACRLP